MGLLDDLFGGGQQKGFEDLAGQLQQGQQAQRDALQQALGFLQPYQQAGTGALGQFQQQLGQMQDPTQYLNQLLQGFAPSQEQQQQTQASLTAAQNALQSQGLGGSGVGARALGEIGQQAQGAGQQQYLQNVLGIQGQEMGGLQNLIGLGAGAGQQGANLAFGTGQGLAGGFQNIGKAQMGADMAGSTALTNMLGTGIGFAAGGPWGAAMGNKLAGFFNPSGGGGSVPAGSQFDPAIQPSQWSQFF